MRKLSVLSCLILIFFAGNALATDLLYPIYDVVSTDDVIPWDVSNWSGGSVVVVGDAARATSQQAFRYTVAGGTQGLLGLSGRTTITSAQGVSANGSIIVGYQPDPDDFLAANEPDGLKFNVGSNASMLCSDPCSHTSQPREISANGAIVAAWGRKNDPTEVGGMKIDVSTGNMTKLHFNMTDMYWASSDGTYTCGTAAWSPHAKKGYVARGNDVYYFPSSTSIRYQVYCITDDGSKAFGEYESTNHTGKVYTWNGSTYAITNMPTTVTGTGTATAHEVYACDGTGAYVVGNALVGGNWVAFIWDTTTNALTPVSSFLSASALAKIPSGFSIEWVTSISPDGSAIVGTLSDGVERLGFVAMVPEPATIALLGLGGLFLIRRKR